MPLGKIYNLTPAKFKSFNSPVCSHNMNNTDTKRQMPKKTEATSNADAGPFFSHTCVYIIMRYKSGISHQRLLPLKRCMPYYHLMRISRLMQAMLFRNFFNFLFSKSYHPLPVLPPVFLSFFLRLFSFRRFSSPHSASFIFLLYNRYTHVCEKKGPASAASASEVFYMTISNLYETHMRTGNG